MENLWCATFNHQLHSHWNLKDDGNFFVLQIVNIFIYLYVLLFVFTANFGSIWYQLSKAYSHISKN